MSLLVSATKFLAHLSDDDHAVAGEVDRVNALEEGAIPNADLLSFSNFLDAYHAFANRTRARAESSNVLVGQVMNDEDDQLIVFERQLRQFQDHFAELGHPAPAPIVPRDSPDHPSNEPGHGGLTLPDLSDPFNFSAGTKVVAGLALVTVLVLAAKR